MKFVSSFKYGTCDILPDNSRDDSDIDREITNMFVRTNT